MELKAQEDIEAPAAQVFAGLCDFDAITTQALRRGVDVTRKDDLPAPAKGMTWQADFQMRGKTRSAEIKVTDLTAPERLCFLSTSGGLEIETRIEVVALAQTRSRVLWHSQITPRSLSARLLVQSLKLTKGSLQKRFRRRVAGVAREFETRLQNG